MSMLKCELHITGQVILDSEQQSVTRLRIEAWDKDTSVTDCVGSATTEPGAEFVILLVAEPREAIYFKVFDANEGLLIASTENTYEWTPGSGKVLIRLALAPRSNGTATLLTVAVYDLSKNRLSGSQAVVTARSQGSSEVFTLEYRPEMQGFQAKLSSRGEYNISIKAGDWDDNRRVTVAGESQSELFIVGQSGMPVYYRAKVKVPFVPKPEIVAVLIRRDAPADQQIQLDEVVQRLHLESAHQTGDSLYRHGIRLYRYANNTSESDKRNAENELRHLLGEKAVGSIISQSATGVSLLGQRAIVRFIKGMDRDSIEKFLLAQNLEVVQSLDYFSENAYLVWMHGAIGYDLLSVLNKLNDNEMVEYAEPVLTSTMQNDSIVPTNQRFQEQWSLGKIAIRDAWEKLAANNHEDRTFGNATVTIAILDQGVETETTEQGVIRPSHPAFKGSLTPATIQHKRFDVFFDFRTMTSTNMSCRRTPDRHPEESHGIQCAGIIAAMSSVGTTPPSAIAGVASNCRMMSLIRPDGDTGSELDYANCYLWAAGLPTLPLPPQPDFPPPLAQGADIIVSCFGPSVMEFPISGTMQDCFNTLTDHGRGGKGTLLFFSVGNNGALFSFERPWAAYNRTIAVAATTENDTRLKVSNDFGSNYSFPLSIAVSSNALIDVCAPGDHILTPVFTTEDVSEEYQPFTGTSAATPIVAGVAALMLSANPALTWQQVRNILRGSAVKIDRDNADLNHGRGLRNTATDPYYSGWYGYGRVNASAAVGMAVAFATQPQSISEGMGAGVGQPV